MHVEFRIDGVQDVHVQDVARQRRGGLQQVILSLVRAGACDVGRRNEIEQALCGAIDGTDLLGRAAGALCVGDRGERRVRCAEWDEERWHTCVRKAEQAVALVERRHCRKRVHGGLFVFVLIVYEEVGLIAAVVDVRDFQRAANICAEAIVVVTDLRRFDSGNRVRPGIKCGVFVAVVEAEADSVYLLAKKASAPSAAEWAPTARAASRTAASPTTSSAKDCSAASTGSAKSLSAATVTARATLASRSAARAFRTVGRAHIEASKSSGAAEG